MFNFNKSIAVIGAQYGDEGKGKITDILAKKASCIVRFNGGNNAEHNIVVKGKKYRFSQIPSGCLYNNKELYLAQGAVVNPVVLLKELRRYKRLGFSVCLWVDYRCHVVMPYHIMLDQATEQMKGHKSAGSIKRGIGYCYEDKNNRRGVRMEDLIDEKCLLQKIEENKAVKEPLLRYVYRSKEWRINKKKIFKEYSQLGNILHPFIVDVSKLLSERKSSGEVVLFEGAQGAMLDVAFGQYPWGTAYHTIESAIFPYCGIHPYGISCIGVVKAYTTRLRTWSAPLITQITPHELPRKMLRGLQEQRDTRCGWLDLVQLRTVRQFCNLNYLAITKLDVLSNFKHIKVCTHYKKGVQQTSTIPIGSLDGWEPVYKTFEGWLKDIRGARDYKVLPVNAKIYLTFIEKELNIPIKIISVGRDRSETIFL